MKTKKNYFIISGLLIMLFTSGVIMAQDSTKVVTTESKPKAPVKSTFETGTLINNQTVTVLNKKKLEMMIQHRFGIVETSSDLFGLFAPSNIRFGFDYGITNRLNVGIGVTKNKRLYDLNWKYLLLKQTKNGGSPVSVAYYGNASRSAVDTANFKNQENEYVGANRFSYFHELMIAKKLNKKISLQLAGTYSHLNIVDTLMRNDVIGISFAGRFKFSAQSSLMVEFDYLLTPHTDYVQKPNLGIGYEVSTGTHQFQVFVCTADAINNAQIMMYNQNDFTKAQFLIGFNITRNWAF